MSLPKSEALKQSDGSFVVRVFHAGDRSTDVSFPYTPEAPLLAIEYADFKNAQRESGPDSPATRAIVAEAKKDQDPLDVHNALTENLANTRREAIAKEQLVDTSAALAGKPEPIKVPIPAGDNNPEVKALEEDTKEEQGDVSPNLPDLVGDVSTESKE